jgi:cytochrome c oxidase subunit II
MRVPFLLGILPLLAGCEGAQSVLDPRGHAADIIARFSWVLFAGAAVIFLGTMAMFAAGLFWPERVKGITPIHLVIGGGFVFPVITLLVLLVYTTLIGRWMDPTNGVAQTEEPLRIDVTGVMWWWEVVYHGHPDGPVVSANEIHLPVGRPVELHLATRDVIHSLWIPPLHGKMDLIPGRTNVLTVQADKPSVMRGQCAEFCGAQHALMAFWVVAHPLDEFDSWLADQARPALPPQTPPQEDGSGIFLSAGCNSCHVIRGLEGAQGAGTGAGTRIGPDLTHIGSRLSLAAATLPNGVGPLAAWIAASQDLKTGNRMPSFHHLDGTSLSALAGYLEGLK